MSRSTNWRGGGHVVKREGGVRRGAVTRSTPRGATPGETVLPGIDDEVDPDELREFMSADWLDVKADPTFREKLRDELWTMLRDRQRNADDDEGGER